MNDPLVPPPAPEEDRRTLEEHWRLPRGFIAWFSQVDHKAIGRRFIITAFVFFSLGGSLAALMRIQLSRPENRFLGPDLYNQIFTMHGTTMMFLFAVPVMLATAVYFVPLMIGARAIAFGRAIAFSYWMFLFGGIFLFTMFILNVGPDAGWFSYVPLSGPEYGIGKRSDVWAQFITFSETSSIVAAVVIIVTILKHRAPGMTLNRMPLYVWAMLIVSFMVVFSLPSVVVASAMLIMDRLVATHFFNPAEGGDSLLWQHLFWFFGHPEVYIIFLPAQGMMSTLISTFAQRPIFGYMALVLALTATAFIGFGVWVHHMFATGLPQLSTGFFTAASIMITIPTAVQFYCWIATLWSGRLIFQTPMLYALGFFAVFMIGGLTGVMLAAVPLDLQVHDTFFVVAHFHYVLIGGAVFPLLGMMHFWLPKISGRMPSERLGRLGFALVFLGFNLTFFPQHILGLYGMPRRVYTYPIESGWGPINMLVTVGAGVLTLGLLVFLTNVIYAFRRGVRAPANPWNAPTLEWATASPPPAYNFTPLPTVSSGYPLWDEQPFDEQPVIVGLDAHKREVLVTRVIDAAPDHRKDTPEPSYWPFLAAVALSVMFVASIFTPWAVVWLTPLFAAAMVGWIWPRRGHSPREFDRLRRQDDRIPHPGAAA